MLSKSKNKNLLIIGAGGHGKVIADIAENIGCYEKIIFADDDESVKECMRYPVFWRKKIENDMYDSHDVFVAVGNSKTREKITSELKAKGVFIPTLIHPKAIIARTATIAEGTVIMAGTVINSDTHIAGSCIINTGCTIDHDCIIGEFCHVSVGAHLAGTVTVGSHTWIGVGACINNNLTIASDCMIGSGAMVIDSIESAGVYIGVPARKKNA